MLTPVTPNPIATSTTIKSHGSETRNAGRNNQLETQNTPSAVNLLLGIGLDAGSILANVNAEAATAGNRTILQTLALAVANGLNITRRNDESMEDFFLRIAAALDDLPTGDRQTIEMRAGLKALKVQIADLAAALKQPDSALAARLSAMAEAPLATPQKTAAAAATTSYLQEAPGVSRAAETLAMVTRARANPEGNSLFSSTPAAPLPERQQFDARSLQAQLKSLFEPGVADTRIEIEKKEEQPNVLILGDDNDAVGADSLPRTDAEHAVQSEPQTVAEYTQAEAGQKANDDPDAGRTSAREADGQSADTTPTDPAQPEGRRTETTATQTRVFDNKQVDAGQADRRSTDAQPVEPTPNIETAQVDAKPTAEKQSGTRQPESGHANARPADNRQLQAGQAGARQVDNAHRDQQLDVKKPVPIDAAGFDSPVRNSSNMEHAERLPETRSTDMPMAQNNNIPSASVRLRAIARELVQEKVQNNLSFFVKNESDGDHRMQTLLTLKGIAEVITAMPAKAAEFLMSAQLVADIKAKEPKASGAKPAEDAAILFEGGEQRPDAMALGRAATGRHSTPLAAPYDGEAAQRSTAVAVRSAEQSEQQSLARASDADKASILRAAASSLDPIPFGFVGRQPDREEFKTDSLEERDRHEDEGEDREDQNQETAEERRERLARKATDDLLRPEPDTEPDLKITRDSTQADRAYALYQRMAGF